MNNYQSTLTYLEKMPNAIAGSGGDKATRQAALVCRRFNLSEGETWDAMQWFNDHKCQPKWSEKDLRHKMSGLQAVAVTKPLGQPQRHNSTRVRVFVAPEPPPTPPPDTRPIVEQSPQDEELWWSKWCVDHGTTLEEFDKSVGNS